MIFGHASSLKVIILRIYGIKLSRADVQECDFFCGWMGILSERTVSNESYACCWDAKGLLDMM